MNERECPECGSTFFPRSPAQKLCGPVCAEKRRKAYFQRRDQARQQQTRAAQVDAWNNRTRDTPAEIWYRLLPDGRRLPRDIANQLIREALARVEARRAARAVAEPLDEVDVIERIEAGEAVDPLDALTEDQANGR